jgi:hypothetical protein
MTAPLVVSLIVTVCGFTYFPEEGEYVGAAGADDAVFPDPAATSVWAAVVTPAEEVGGRYCENGHVSDIVADDVRLGLLDEGVRGYALDPESAKALWKKSEEMVGEVFA